MFRLEATGLGGGRLRGRDRAADVERHPAAVAHRLGQPRLLSGDRRPAPDAPVESNAMADGPPHRQSDRTVLLEVAHHPTRRPRGTSSRSSPSSNARRSTSTPIASPASGCGTPVRPDTTPMRWLQTLDRWSRFPVPASVSTDIRETVGRYGRLVIERDEDGALVLRSTDPPVLGEVSRNKRISPAAHRPPDSRELHGRRVGARPHQAELLKIGWPAEDLAGYTPGTPHPIDLAEDGWKLRRTNVRRSSRSRRRLGSRGAPLRRRKTLVGAGAMAETRTTTLILVTNTVSARQWRDELLRRTSLTPKRSASTRVSPKEIKPVTIATYQILTAKRGGKYAHLALLDALDWGLVLYDEVHLLPAPVFKLTADLQARRRLGLTATLVREDGREGDVFSLNRSQAVRRALEGDRGSGLHLPRSLLRGAHRPSGGRTARVRRRRRRGPVPSRGDRPRQDRRRQAPRGPASRRTRPGDRPVPRPDRRLSDALDAPKITGATPVAEREELFQAFREARSRFSWSRRSPTSRSTSQASVAVQVSGSFGSRQEERSASDAAAAEAVGHTASFYTLIARDTVDQDFAQNRQRFPRGAGLRLHDPGCRGDRGRGRLSLPGLGVSSAISSGSLGEVTIMGA